MVNNKVVQTDELNKQAEEVQDPEGGFKRFKDKEKFITLVNKLGVHKATIIFKINVYKLCERYPRLLKSSIRLGFLKNYYKDIKETCYENSYEFA